jgi:F0F1-type ATP synthase assembly protein I
MGNSQLISAGIIAGVLIIGWLVQRFIKAAA